MKNRLSLAVLALSVPFALNGCGEPVGPATAQAQSSELAEIRRMLTTVIERLDALETEMDQSHAAIRAGLDTLQIAVASVGPGPGGPMLGGYLGVEATLCAKNSWEANARMQSAVTLRGQADGMLGIDAYGNGAKGRVMAYGAQMVSVIPQGGMALELQLCGKLGGQGSADTEFAGLIGGGDPIVALLSDLGRSVSTTRLANAASTMNMDGARSGQAVDALAGLSLSNFPFGGGGAQSYLNALALPNDLRSAINQPSRILGEAAAAGQYAVSQLCGNTLRVGEFAQALSAGCDLRDDIPPPAEVVEIISGLNGLPTTLGTLQTSVGGLETTVSSLNSRVATACNTMGGMTNGRIIIPSRSVTILGTAYTTFPGYNAPLFPNIGAPAC